MKNKGLRPNNLDTFNLLERGFHLLVIGECPTCGYEDINEVNNYCSNCGQKLDWDVSRKED